MKNTLQKVRARVSKSPSAFDLPYATPAFRAADAKRRIRLIERLRRTYAERGLVLYLGAGVSASAGYPTWDPMIHRMLSRVFDDKATGPRAETDENLTAAERAREKFAKAVRRLRFGERRSLTMLARILRRSYKHDLASHVAFELYFDAIGEWLVDDRWPREFAGGKRDLDLDLMSSPLIDTIARISARRTDVAGVHSIVNYNFDDLVDEVLRQTGTDCATLCSPADRLRRNALPCYHVHGVVPMRAYARSWNRSRSRERLARGDFVFSEEEYHRQYAEPFRWSNLVQTSLLGSHDGLFVGLSMDDPNIRRLLDVAHSQYPQRRNYAIFRRERPLAKADDTLNEAAVNMLEEIETEGLSDLGVDAIWVDRFEEIPPLLNAIAGLEPLARKARKRARR